MIPTWESDGTTLYLGDCLEVLPTLTGIDAVVTDPPYGINGAKGRVNKERGRGNYSGAFEDSPAYIAVTVIPIVKQLIELCGCVVLTPGNRNLCLYPQPDSFGCFYQPASVGLQIFGNADSQPIFYYGKNRLPNMGRRLSWQVTEPPSCTEHPCSKPLRIWKSLLCSVTRDSDTILDPFMGSGTTGVACVQMGRRFVGIEIEPRYFEIAKRRISEAQQQLRLAI